MSALGMFGKVAAGYLKAAEANQDKQTAAEKEQRQTATSILMKLVDDPSTQPETIKWALENLTSIAPAWKAGGPAAPACPGSSNGNVGAPPDVSGGMGKVVGGRAGAPAICPSSGG